MSICSDYRAPDNHKKNLVKRLIALPGQWIQIPESSEMLKIPEGHCWVEGDNSACSLDSRSFGPVSSHSHVVFLRINANHTNPSSRIEVCGI